MIYKKVEGINLDGNRTEYYVALPYNVDIDMIQKFNEDNELDLFTILKILDNGIANMKGVPLYYELLLDLDSQRFIALSNCVRYNQFYGEYEDIDDQYTITEFRFCDYGKTYKEIEK